MNFKIIDKNHWNRKEYFDHYSSTIPCTYSMTVNLDISKIKNENRKLYPTMLYLITRLVNSHSEFRTTFNSNGQLGIYDEMIPSYTIFNKETELFSNIWTNYNEDYCKFYNSYEKDVATFSSINKILPKGPSPENTFSVSMIPWTTFQGFNLNLQKGYDYLLPIFTLGKYYKENNTYLLPMAIQVHHAVCDGFHICRFINELQELIENHSL